MAQKEISDKNLYKHQCKECGMLYKTQELALECERWCREHKSCNLDIIKQGKSPEQIGSSS